MLTLSVATDVDPTRWDRTVTSLDGGVFHSHGWARSWTHDGHSQPVFFTWHDGTRREVAAAVGFMRPRPRSALGWLATRLRFNAAPAAHDGSLGLLDPLMRWARRQPALVEVRLGAHDLRTAWGAAETPVADRTQRFEFIVSPIDGAPDYTRMRRGMRSSLRRARDTGVTVREARDAREVERFASICEEFTLRLGARKTGVDQIDATFAARQWNGMIDDGCARMFLGWHESEIVSGVLVGRCGAHAYGLEVGELPRARETLATHLVHQVSFETLFADGVLTMNIGGVPAEAASEGHPDHGLFRFKESLSTRTIAGEAGGVVTIRAARGRALNTARRLLGAASTRDGAIGRDLRRRWARVR